jgi:DNA gyrase subunit B
MSGEALEGLMRDYMVVQAANIRLAKRYDANLLDQLIENKQFSVDWSMQEAAEWCASVEAKLNQDTPPSVSYKLVPQESDEGVELALSRITYGVIDTTYFKKSFFRSPEYRLTGRLADTLTDLIQSGAVIQRGKSEESVSTFAEVHDWLMNESRKGRTFQRFKGLGEMNPEQLWDTTVNPETRRLLKVTIEDVVAADEIFTTLMGDEVEPRRDFIERNALDVTNLDV